MDIKSKIFFLGFLSVLKFSLAAQNLCNDAKANGWDFAVDPSHCTRYLYCHRDASNTDDNTNILAVYYRQCDQSSSFKYFKDGKCISDSTHCVNSIDICPGGSSSKIKSANKDDDQCNEYRYCALTGSPFSKCLEDPNDSWQFDRNSGACVDNTGGNYLPDCPNVDPNAPTTTTTAAPTNVCESITENFIYVQDGNCSGWAFCYMQEVFDRDVCPCDQKFGSASINCVSDITCNPCTTTTTDSGTTVTTTDTTTITM